MKRRRVLLVILSAAVSGCITRAGGSLEPITPEPAATRPAIEQTVGDFAFSAEGLKLVTSLEMGRGLNEEILKRWTKRGYISTHHHVPESQFSRGADFHLTLSGSQYRESSIVMQLLSGLTLCILPHTAVTKYDIQVVVENVRTGEKHSAAVEESYHTTVELLLLFAAPISMRGQSRTMDAMADHLYAQLRSKGAFDPPAAPAVAERPAAVVSQEAGAGPAPPLLEAGASGRR